MTLDTTIMDDKSKENHRISKEKDNEDELWHFITKDVRPIKKNLSWDKDSNHKTDKKSVKKDRTEKAEYPNNNTLPDRLPKTEKQSDQIDRRTDDKLRRGQMHIDARLDLHGLNQHQAYDALIRFISTSYQSGRRCVLVITGKGGRMYNDQSLLDRTPGILRQKTPEWLNEYPCAEYVLKYHAAKQKDGGDGALYVLLKRRRGE